jgi:hypothetical protein
MLPEKAQNKFLMESNSFALSEFDKPLTLLQMRLYYMSVGLIERGEDPEAQVAYKLNLADMARMLEVSPKSFKSNMRCSVEKMKEANVGLVTDMDGKRVFMFGIYQSVEVPLDDPNSILIRFNYNFRKKILEMKKVHDIEYPLSTLFAMNSKYSIPLYVNIIAEFSIQRDTNPNYEGQYDLYFSKERLIRIFHYDGPIDDFKRKALQPAVKGLDNTEVCIKKITPEKQGRTVIGYTFTVMIATSPEKQIFVKPILTEESDWDIPTMDYLSNKLLSFGVSEQLVNKIRLSNDRVRTWNNMLYTWFQVGNSAKYFNKAYHEDYFKSVGTSTRWMFRCLTFAKPEYRQDEMIRYIDEQYDRLSVDKNPHFIDELVKHMKRMKERHGDCN